MAKYEIKNGVGIIPEGTKEIEVDAFAGCTDLTSVTIPESVMVIGDGAFWCCENLTAIVIPASVKQVGHSLFGGCKKLKSIVVDEGNTIYDSREQCNAIIETATGRLVAGCVASVIPKSVKEIGLAAFRNCTNLQEIRIPDGVTIIDGYAFNDCLALTSVVLPGVTKIGEGAFFQCRKLTNLVLPKTLKEMGKAALSVTGLTKIEVPDSLTEIPDIAFAGTRITSITIPASVTKIGNNAFKSCRDLEYIRVPEGKEEFFKGLLPEELHVLINKIPAINESKELDDLYRKLEDTLYVYLEKAEARIKTLSEISAKKNKGEFGWMNSNVPDSEEEAYEEFQESQFCVICYDDFAYQTCERIGVRFRLAGSQIVITAYYDDEEEKIVENCELLFPYSAVNYRAMAACIKTVEHELG